MRLMKRIVCVACRDWSATTQVRSDLDVPACNCDSIRVAVLLLSLFVRVGPEPDPDESATRVFSVSQKSSQ